MAIIQLEQAVQDVENLKHTMQRSSGNTVAVDLLKKIYQTDPWYSARYRSGQALGIVKQSLSAQLDTWIDELEKKLDSQCTNSITFDLLAVETGYDCIDRMVSMGTQSREYTVLNLADRMAAVLDLGWILHNTDNLRAKALLETVYNTDLQNVPKTQFETDFENSLAMRDPNAHLSLYLTPYIQPFDNAYSYHRYCQISDEAGRQLGQSPWDVFQKRTTDFAHANFASIAFRIVPLALAGYYLINHAK